MCGHDLWEIMLKQGECLKVETYLKKTFCLDNVEVRLRPHKDDSADVYLGKEFIGVLFRDDEDGELSYSFQMAILEMDLE
jgi:hypothetical protein